MQKSLQIVENSPKNNHKKYEARSCNGQQYTPSADLRKCIKTRSFYRSRCCFAHATDWKNRSKSSKIIDGGMHSVYGRARREAGQFEVYFNQKYFFIEKLWKISKFHTWDAVGELCRSVGSVGDCATSLRVEIVLRDESTRRHPWNCKNQFWVQVSAPDSSACQGRDSTKASAYRGLNTSNKAQRAKDHQRSNK